MLKTFSLASFPVAGKIVLLRVDYNVPLSHGKVMDNRRIRATLPTIYFLLKQGCTIVLATHLGRPEGKVVPVLRTKVLLPELQCLLPGVQITALDDCIGKKVRDEIVRGKIRGGSSKQKGVIFLLENLRFYKEEEENDPLFAHMLASLAEVYVNDAFAVSHRKHASVHAVTTYLPSMPGFLLEKEVQHLSQALSPKRPAVWILGGAKLNKVKLLEQALTKADIILIGGALAFSFLKARGFSVGVSVVDKDSVRLARTFLRRKDARKIVLPLDVVVAENFSPRAKSSVVEVNTISSSQLGLDIGPRTVELFQGHLQRAKTIVWNGPLGYFEWAQFAQGTKAMGRFIGTLQAQVMSICGGGETAEAMEKFHLVHHFTHVSTGGGASLEFLAGKKLPGIEALKENYQKWKWKVRNRKWEVGDR